jgi:N-acetylmuramoyl-L-alanine amidase/Putative peptidoglycan binding domain
MTQHSSIAISSGHGKYIRGASGYLDEVDEARRVVEHVADILHTGGVKVMTFHDNTSHDQNTNLNTIVNWHNKQTRELDVSVHFNAYQTTSSPMGTECLYVTQQTLSGEVSHAVARATGLPDRGAKKRTDLFFLSNTEEPAILIETVFVDSKADANAYNAHFDTVCQAIAEAIAGKSLMPGPTPPDPEPEPPDPPIRPPDNEEPRPLIGQGDYGNNVREVQACLQLVADGDFGPKTHNAVMDYQRTKGLSVDGLVGEATWTALEDQFGLMPYPPPLPPRFADSVIREITNLAEGHAIADYNWHDRGQAPAGYIKGMAMAYAQACMRYNAGDPIAQEWGKANTGNDAVDALSWYNSNFTSLGMSNSADAIETMRHLFVLLLGLGMRESSGQFCCGRDQSATNTSSDTAEAGLFQTSWNARSCCTDFLNLSDQWDKDSPQGYMSVFSEEVSCSSSDWACYGSGDGFRFQELCKYSPTFAVETCATGLRNLRQHWGPINRKEAEIRREADDLFKQVQEIVNDLDGLWLARWDRIAHKAPTQAYEATALLARKAKIKPGSADQFTETHRWLVDSVEHLLRKQT